MAQEFKLERDEQVIYLCDSCVNGFKPSEIIVLKAHDSDGDDADEYLCQKCFDVKYGAESSDGDSEW